MGGSKPGYTAGGDLGIGRPDSQQGRDRPLAQKFLAGSSNLTWGATQTHSWACASLLSWPESSSLSELLSSLGFGVGGCFLNADSWLHLEPYPLNHHLCGGGGRNLHVNKLPEESQCSVMAEKHPGNSQAPLCAQRSEHSLWYIAGTQHMLAEWTP